MRVLFDHGTPRGLVHLLPEQPITRASAMGWAASDNGELLQAAENAAFEVLLTTDQGLRYQQNLARRKIAIVVLSGSTKWSCVRLQGEHICCGCAIGHSCIPGSYVEVVIPFA